MSPFHYSIPPLHFMALAPPIYPKTTLRVYFLEIEKAYRYFINI